MADRYELLGQIRHDPLGAAVAARRHALVQRRDLAMRSREPWPFVDIVTTSLQATYHQADDPGPALARRVGMVKVCLLAAVIVAASCHRDSTNAQVPPPPLQAQQAPL
ncbi:MAG: hypothetical protein ACM31C_18890, partial [Acidobacteriota bacterium]